MRNLPVHYQRSKGVALLTAMLITALATTVAVGMIWDQQLDIRRTGNIIDRSQTYYFSLGIEAWASQLLVKDKKKGNTDHLSEDWAKGLPEIKVEGAVVSGTLEDMQGRFNINNLVKNGQASPPDLAYFKRLLGVLDLKQALAETFVDWIDPDQNPRFLGGAEDNDYLSLEPAYRSAGTPMVSLSEMGLVKGVDEKVYNKLLPNVSVLPKRSTINVNTAPAPVLAAIAGGLTLTDGEDLVDNRPDKGHADVAGFMADNLMQGQTTLLPTSSLSVSSEFFMSHAKTTFGEMEIKLHSLFFRDNETGKTHTVMRSQGVY